MAKVGKVLLTIVLMIALLAVGAVAAYYNQHTKVKSLNGHIAQLNGKLAEVSKQNNDLNNKLNQANQAVSSLTKTSSFAPGSPCQTEQLAFSEVPGSFGAAAGNRYVVLSYQNTSSSTCTLEGYPGFLALDSSGHVIPDGPIQTNGTPTTLTLASNDKAYFLLHFGTAMPPSTCINASLIESTPPGDTYPLLLTTNGFNVCGPYIDVSALGPKTQFSIYLNGH